ncbi:Retrovirus-related Pol polyprotein [Labeo rohita]|uniref:Gypsy retrotransposon integrase-like protein 1 n=1 Tax=Labeo rohita TaxID=84645 RepID=A0ABQ8L5D5_LABRO|nr:Retrovirus-related Pol polyprotein [Labeo rohita]
MVLYYQRFIQNFSTIAKPLFALTATPRGTKTPGKGAAAFEKLGPGEWREEHSRAFQQLKAALVTEGETRARPIAFACKALTRAQAKYPAHRLEFLALKWSVCDKFSHWLKGHDFVVWTDNNPLTYILTKPKLDACEQRWVSRLVPYRFSIKYIPGSKNIVADALSRQPFIHNRVSQRLLNEPYSALLEEAQQFERDTVQDAFRLSGDIQSTGDPPCVTANNCPLSSAEVSAVLEGHSDCEAGVQSRAVSLIAQDTQQLLPPYHYQSSPWKNSRRNSRRILVCPGSFFMSVEVMMGVHDEAGHQGQNRTMYLMRQRFFWVGLEHDVRGYVKCCKRCVVSKTLEPEGRAPLESVKTSIPMELVCIDFWTAENSKVSKAGSATAVGRYFCVYGFPDRIHSDQGANFESHLIRELLQVAGVKKSRTTAYHPMGNGLVERFNRTLGSMIRALPPRSKEKWSQLLQTLTFAYNCTAHESTGYAPFYLMFGRIPKLPVDVMFGNVERDCDIVDYDKYVKRMKDDLKEALTIAQRNIDASQLCQTELYNQKTKGCNIELGDQVLLANKGERGKRKLADRWESTPYRVVALNPQCHIYQIRNTKTGHERTVNRNLLLQANFLPLELEEPELSEISGGSALGSRNVFVDDDVGPGSELCSVSERVASWVEKTLASRDPQQRLPCRSDSAASLDVIPGSSGQGQVLSRDDCTREDSNVGSPDEGLSCDSHSALSEIVLHDRRVSPVGDIEPPPAQGDRGVRTRGVSLVEHFQSFPSRTYNIVSLMYVKLTSAWVAHFSPQILLSDVREADERVGCSLLSANIAECDQSERI